MKTGAKKGVLGWFVLGMFMLVVMGAVSPGPVPSGSSSIANSAGLGTNATIYGLIVNTALTNTATFYTDSVRLTNNITVAAASAPSTNVVDLNVAVATNILNGALTLLHATNGAANYEQTHVRWLWAGGADRALTIPTSWKTNVNSAVPANITNGTITKMYVTSIGDTASSANQSNVFVSFEFYK